MTSALPPEPLLLRVLTVNTHKGFNLLNRRFVLPELRDAVRAVNADVVFLQEVQGEYAHHAAVDASWPQGPHYEFLADEIWPQFAYGRNAVYQKGDHGNAVLSKYPIVRHQNRDVSLGGIEARGLLHCVLKMPKEAIEVHVICVHLGLREHHRRRQLELLCRRQNRRRLLPRYDGLCRSDALGKHSRIGDLSFEEQLALARPVE